MSAKMFQILASNSYVKKFHFFSEKTNCGKPDCVSDCTAQEASKKMGFMSRGILNRIEQAGEQKLTGQIDVRYKCRSGHVATSALSRRTSDLMRTLSPHRIDGISFALLLCLQAV